MRKLIVGNKELVTYVKVAEVWLEEDKRIKIVGGGKHIKKAVDLLEVLKRNFVLKDINITTKTVQLEVSKVSVIEIEVGI